MRKLLWIMLFTLTAALLASAGCAKKAEPPQPQPKQEAKAPETTEQPTAVPVSSSDKPEACASCHAKENALPEVIKKIQGHPAVQAKSVSDCAGCHKKQGYPELKKIIHKSHYTGEKNVFVDKFKGSCVHCHKKGEQGEIFIPGIAPAGTKSVTIEVYQIDKAPNGCLDCHKGGYSLPNMIKKISGHPGVNFEDFNKCYNCHGKTAPQLGKVLHNRHLGNDIFKKNYGNSCLNCHKPTTDNDVIVKGKK
ncbi:MAG TPA: hypothetical protein VHS59_04995 [Bacillota bacterium]|nr:hypothetical protein [Bacillota bacterium]